MRYSIENEWFKIEVDECGAELCSMISKKTGVEYIWQADPKVWKGASPVLFPIIGALKGQTYHYQGTSYTLPKHGFFRGNTNVRLISRTPSRLSFALSSDQETLARYPFSFEIKISFLLADRRLQVFHEVTNVGNSPMYFSLGGHPAFNYPWKEGENKDDYYLQFEQKENNVIYEVLDNGLLSGREKPLLKNDDRLYLEKGLFDQDALIFKETNSSNVSLRSKKSKNSISIQFSDFPYLAIWSKPEAKFLCIEPWHGLPDFEKSKQELTKKQGIIKLPSGNIHYASYTIQIFES